MSEQRAKDLATGYAIVRDEKCLEPDCEVCVGDARAIADAIEAARTEERERWERKIEAACAEHCTDKSRVDTVERLRRLAAHPYAQYERVLLAILESESET